MITAAELRQKYGLESEEDNTQQDVVSEDTDNTAERRVTNNNLIIEAIKNTPASAVKLGRDILAPIFSPIETAKSIGAVGASVISLLRPGEQGNEELAKQVGQFYADRYGSLENIKRTFSQER